jgi:indole-3-glycerol phosphate synthase
MNDACLFSGAILKAKDRGVAPIVADIKPISPRDGDLVRKREPAELAQSLVAAGACALSVVTEPKHFGGNIQMLREVTRAVSVPVLRKDFFTSVHQIDESYEAGAAALLLIMATIPESQIPVLYERTRELGMEAVVEIHDRLELERGLALAPTIIGINNRDILQFERDSGDVRVTEELAPLVPDTVVTISESSLYTPEEIKRAFKAGADAVLIGTAILKSDNPTVCLKGLINQIGHIPK